jgi:hypothetical protein
VYYLNVQTQMFSLLNFVFKSVSFPTDFLVSSFMNANSSNGYFLHYVL